MPHQCTNCDRTFADGSKEMLSGCPDCGGTKFQFQPDGFDGGEADDAVSSAAESTTPDPEPEPEPPDRPGDAMTRTVGSAAATVKDLVSGGASPDTTEAAPPAGADPQTQTGDGGDDDIIVAESAPANEDTAQADARTQLVEPDEVDPDGFDPAVDDGLDSEPETTPEEPDEKSRLEADVENDPAEGAEAGESAASSDEEGGGSERTVAAEPDAERTVAAEPDAERTDRPDLSELREELNEQFESIRVVEPGQYELNLMELYDREEYIIALQEDGRYSIQMPETWREADA